MNRIHFTVGALALAAFAAPSFAGDGDCQVIVGFKGAPSDAALNRIGAGDDDVDTSLRIAVMTVKASKISALRADPDVAYVEEDAIVEASAKGGKPGKPVPTPTPPPPPPPQPTQQIGWGTQRVWGAAQPSATGAGIKVAVIDTGIDLTHPDLQANIKGGVTFVSFTTPDDDNGHGSNVAGIIGAVNNSIGYVGVAPGASLYAVKVLDRNGSGTVSAVAQGIDWARLNGMNIANMSLGSPSPSLTIENACNSAQAAGVLVVVAAGNNGDGSTATTELFYPAAHASVVAVGATDINDNLASFSNTGSFVDVSAPGVSIANCYRDGLYATLSGTSMASPHAAGMAALLWTAGSTEATVRAALYSHVRDLGAPSFDNGFGWGIVYYP
jgi:subtilisin family serine protease